MTNGLVEIIEKKIQSINEIGEGNIKISRGEIERAVAYIPKMRDEVKRRVDIVISDNPDVCPLDDGSIDFDWSTGDYMLLLNVKAEQKERAGYYYGEFSIGRHKVQMKGDLH